MKSDVAIIGAGVIGCSIAYYLAKANVSVCLIEKAERVGAEASWAGAGILASHASTQEPYAALCRASLELYPELAESLRLETQIDVEFIRCGSIAVAFTEDEKRAMNGLAERRQDRGFSAEMLSGDEVRTLEPALSQSVIGGVLFPHDAQVRNPKLVKALAKSAAQVGAQFLLGNPVTAFVSEGGRISGVVVNGSAHHADTYVIACGCWSGQIASLLGYSLPVGPAKGQMVLAEAMPPMLRHVIDGLGVYLVPRADGKLLIGATVEFVGYDKRATIGGAREMIEAGVALMPEIAHKSFVQTWAGLRPYGKRPYLGCVPGFDNLIVASGHHKNGILLAPITGKLIAELITTGCPSLLLEPFQPPAFLAPSY